MVWPGRLLLNAIPSVTVVGMEYLNPPLGPAYPFGVADQVADQPQLSVHACRCNGSIETTAGNWFASPIDVKRDSTV